MKTRCFNPRSTDFVNYGGRGISVCEDWLNFAQFKEWAVNHGYDDTLTIERDDGNGNYTAENCRWIPKSLQSRNRRKQNPATFSRGAKHYLTRLTEDDVREIKASPNFHGVLVMLADKYGVSAAVIGKIRRGTTWKHV